MIVIKKEINNILIPYYNLMNEYETQAQEFLDATGTTITKEFIKYDTHFIDDIEKRNIRSITLKNKRWSYTFNFGDSIINSAKYKTSESLPIWYWKVRGTKLINAVDKYNKSLIKKTVNLKDCNDTIMKHIFALAWNHSQTTTGNDGILKYLEPIAPDNISILSCLDLTYEDNFNDRCDSFGYDTDSKSADIIYLNCIEQDRMLRRLFNTKELDLLSEIN